MGETRLIKLEALDMQEGDAANVRRLFPRRELRHLDPFVQLDELTVTPPAGFPPHEHRGFEAITYVLRGALHHADNLGNEAVVAAEGAQRFNAGGGMMHAELPADEGTSRAVQLWVALARADKQMPPVFQQAEAAALPEDALEGGGRRRVIAGPGSSLELRTPVRFVWVELPKRKTLDEPVPQGHRGFLYLLDGRLEVKAEGAGQATLVPGEAVLVDAPTTLSLRAKKPSSFVFAWGRPHGEPIRHWGTYVD